MEHDDTDLRDRLSRCLTPDRVEVLAAMLGRCTAEVLEMVATGVPDLALVAEACEMLGISADWLLFGNGDGPDWISPPLVRSA
ncbi:MAG: hypothetical protein KF866_03665 [Phycisphaeraceae bacterium]|nr:hypothetical protein [Phycisphaeraceae bacterium]